jgi:regulator of protease activity HflC (stomatin/prohibitin superfamily)
MAIKEKELRPISGFIMLAVLIAALAGCTAMVIYAANMIDTADAMQYVGTGSLFMPIAILFGVIGWCVFGFCLTGLKAVHPNEARVFTLFGRYHGTIKRPGYFYVNPFCASFNARQADSKPAGRHKAGQTPSLAVSLKVQTLDNGLQKVNDVLGNPIIIGAVVIWRVDNPTQAVFSVENYFEYLGIQTDSTIRNTARLYPYDIFDEDEGDDGVHEQTLRGSSLEIADYMQAELQKRVTYAGLVIEEVRITHLAYAEEIAAAMLQRQQAVAIIAARQKIVDGAVGMVRMAIDKLGANDIVVLDDERKAAMVSNLLVVLVGNHDAQPIVNTGSIH